MSFIFYLNAILAILALLLPLTSSVINDINSHKLTKSTFFLVCIVVGMSISKPTDIADYNNIIAELSWPSTHIQLKYIVLTPIISLPGEPHLKLIFVSFLSFLILYIALKRFLDHFILSTYTYSVAIYALYPLFTFHYRQFLSFSLTCLLLSNLLSYYPKLKPVNLRQFFTCFSLLV